MISQGFGELYTGGDLTLPPRRHALPMPEEQVVPPGPTDDGSPVEEYVVDWGAVVVASTISFSSLTTA